MLKSVSITCTGKSTEAVIDEIKGLIEKYGESYYVKLFLWNDVLTVDSLEGHLEKIQKLHDEQNLN